MTKCIFDTILLIQIRVPNTPRVILMIKTIAGIFWTRIRPTYQPTSIKIYNNCLTITFQASIPSLSHHPPRSSPTQPILTHHLRGARDLRNLRWPLVVIIITVSSIQHQNIPDWTVCVPLAVRTALTDGGPTSASVATTATTTEGRRTRNSSVTTCDV